MAVAAPDPSSGGAGHTGPLRTVRAVVAGTSRAPVIVGSLLADLGADVVVIEPPGGHPLRREALGDSGAQLSWLTLARNVRSVVVDAVRADGASLARDLALAADVVVDDGTSGLAEAWGAGMASLRGTDPSLITVSLTPHGEDGPLAQVAGTDVTAEALAGLAHITGDPAREPLHSDFPVGSAVGALFGSYSILAALYQRDHAEGAPGTHIDLACYEAILRILEFLPAYHDQLGWVTDRTNSTSDYQVPVNRWLTADDVWMSFTGNAEEIVQRLFRAIDRPELGTDERFHDNAARVEHRAALEEILAEWFAQHDRAEVADAMERERVPIAAILSMADLFEEPQYAARGTITSVSDASHGTVRTTDVAGRFSRTPGSVRHLGPALGADQAAVVAEWLDADARRARPDHGSGRPRPGSHLLAGLRVLDIGNVIAGPFTATLLADLGADVVKVERPEVGDMFRHLAPLKEDVSIWWKVGGRGKRSLALDLKAEGDREQFLELVRHADVVVENFVPGVAASLRIDAESLAEVNPRLVYVSISGYGQDGPLAGLRAFGRNAEAYSGMAFLTGYPGGIPQHTGFPVADSFSALLAAFGALAAVHERDAEGSGLGQHLDIALFESVFRFMEPYIALYDRTGEVWERGRAVVEPAVWRRVVPSSEDRWLTVAVSSAAGLPEIAAWLGCDEADLLDPGVDLGRWSRRRSLDELRTAAAGAGVAVAPATTIEDLVVDPHVQARGMLATMDDPDLGALVMPAIVPVIDGARPVITRPAPRLDADRADVLIDWGATPRQGDS